MTLASTFHEMTLGNCVLYTIFSYPTKSVTSDKHQRMAVRKLIELIFHLRSSHKLRNITCSVREFGLNISMLCLPRISRSCDMNLLIVRFRGTFASFSPS